MVCVEKGAFLRELVNRAKKKKEARGCVKNCVKGEGGLLPGV